MNKQELRDTVTYMIDQLSTKEKERQSRVVNDMLSGLIKEHNSSVILLYNSLPDELNVRPTISACLEQGKTVVLPKITDIDRMEVYQIMSLDDCVVGAFGILEPVGEVTAWGGPIDLAVVPGRVFDERGGRVGRGRGYYDRFLAGHQEVYKTGVCFKEQIRTELPMEERDVQMDILLHVGKMH